MLGVEIPSSVLGFATEVIEQAPDRGF
jgi:hypothetical protein